MTRAMGGVTWRVESGDTAGCEPLYRRVEQIDEKLVEAVAAENEVLCGRLLAEKVDLLQQVLQQIRRPG